MDDNIITTFCRGDALLTAMHHREDDPWQMNDADIMPPALTASLGCRGNHASTRAMRQHHGDSPPMLR